MVKMQDIKGLLEHADDHMLSLYLNVDPSIPENQAATPAWRIWMKNALRELEAGLDGAEVERFTQLRANLEAELAYYQPESKGLALICGPSITHVFELTVRVGNYAAFGKPVIMPMLWAMDEYEPYVVILVDHEKARLITAQLDGRGHQETITLSVDTSDWARKTQFTTSGAVEKRMQRNARDDFERRVEMHRERFYEEVAQRAAQLAAEHEARRIVIAGAEEAGHQVRKLLPEPLQTAVVGVVPLPMKSTDSEVLSHVLPVALAYERHQELDLVEQVIGMAKAGGRAVLGKVAVEHALNRQQVDLLLVPWPLSDEEVVQDMPLKTYQSGGMIELVHGVAASRLKEEGGLAARLYYAPGG